jgi:hypothetical protein
MARRGGTQRSLHLGQQALKVALHPASFSLELGQVRLARRGGIAGRPPLPPRLKIPVRQDPSPTPLSGRKDARCDMPADRGNPDAQGVRGLPRCVLSPAQSVTPTSEAGLYW